MAWFDVGAGLAQMGETVGKIAGASALEYQKNGLEKERLKLASDLAMERQTQQQGFEMEKLDKTQTFTAGENEKNRASDLERTKISAGASITAAGISAAASKYAADSRIKAAEMEMEALRPGREATARKTAAEATILEGSAKLGEEKSQAELDRLKAVTEQTRADATLKVITADAAKREQDAKTALSDAMKSGDQDAIAAAKNDYAIATMSNSDQVKTAQTAATMAEMYRKELENARNQLTQLEKSTSAMMPDGKEAIEQKRKEIREKESVWRKYAAEAQRAFKALPKIDSGEEEPARPPQVDIRQFLKPKQSTPASGTGIINSVPGGAP